MKKLVAMLVVLVSAGCHPAGTWRDDERNWQRAFRSTKPADVVVVHSQFWRSAHWTYEFEYFFHIKSNAPLREQLFTANDLEEIPGTNMATAVEDFFQDKPGWFLPGSATNYDAWIYRTEPRGNFRVFIHRDSRDLFITDYQI